MLDEDLAIVYQVETKVFNQAVKRNIDRFPDYFRFQLTEEEFSSLRSQIVTSKSSHGGRRYLPYAFTEQGIAMLSAVLRSDIAIKISVKIMQAFVEMRQFITTNAAIFQRLDSIEIKQLETDKQLKTIFKAIDSKSSSTPNQGIFYDGQVYDAHSFMSTLIRKAKKSLVLIDNYINDSVITLFTKKRHGVQVTILTKSISKQVKLDISKFNEQYSGLKAISFDKSHDRFLIIDDEEIYHVGASLKDLGKKWFAFSRMDKTASLILKSVKQIITESR